LLSSHELDTKGTKPILVARLKSYLESLPPKGEGESSPAKPVAKPVETEETADDEDEAMEEEATAKVAAPAAAATPKKEVTKEDPAKAEEAAKEATTEEAETPKADGDENLLSKKANNAVKKGGEKTNPSWLTRMNLKFLMISCASTGKTLI
jgi:hypothetical protein